jgi:hypothetical protein
MLLLPATAVIRFVPDGTIDNPDLPNLRVRAWDGSLGEAGTLVDDDLEGGGTNPYNEGNTYQQILQPFEDL